MKTGSSPTVTGSPGDTGSTVPSSRRSAGLPGVLGNVHRPGETDRPQGRPEFRLAAWRTVWRAQRANPVDAARYRHLTARATNKLTPTQAQAVIAAAILRHLHAVITTGRTWDPDIATHGTTPAAAATAA